MNALILNFFCRCFGLIVDVFLALFPCSFITRNVSTDSSENMASTQEYSLSVVNVWLNDLFYRLIKLCSVCVLASRARVTGSRVAENQECEKSCIPQEVRNPAVRQARRLDSASRQCPSTLCLSGAEVPGQGDWTLLRDNTQPHTALLVQKFLDRRGVVSLNHPPYSPDLSPPDFFLFPKLISALKDHRISHISDIQRNVTTQLKVISKDGYVRSFQDLYNCSQKCIAIDGDYFERQ
ncbi:hypothetical protein AVEN_159312-1 [Araneus ventricosus]|uniref:Histone-lysine N-methyltransferase SETMAR n=1 Tax=Araneus ventricosus TaxID=182803 RepID=A0A4Y2A0I5_ARAVE|nr:hypothetical protein AVEN_159312-1 [Araneus ventricosus]